MIGRIRRATAIAEDLKEPRLEPLPLLVTRKRAVQTHEGVLHHVFRVVGIPQHRARKAETARVIRVDDLGERVNVSELGASDRPRWAAGGLSGMRQSKCGQKVLDRLS